MANEITHVGYRRVCLFGSARSAIHVNQSDVPDARGALKLVQRIWKEGSAGHFVYYGKTMNMPNASPIALSEKGLTFADNNQTPYNDSRSQEQANDDARERFEDPEPTAKEVNLRPARGLRYCAPEPLQVVGLVGGIGVGKGSVATFMKENLGYEILNFAAKGKTIIQDVFDCPRSALWGSTLDKANARESLGWHSGRHVMEELLEKFREIDKDVWVRYVDRHVTQGKVVFADVRYPNEVEWIKSKGGIVIHISRLGYASPRTYAESDLCWKDLDCDSWLSLTNDFSNMRGAVQRALKEYVDLPK